MAKKVVEHISEVKVAWLQLAPDTKFSGMTLAEFETAVQASAAERDAILKLEALLAGARKRREDADLAARETVQAVVNAVRGDPAHGADSALYRACGYIPKSERRSGLTRKSKKTTTAPISSSSVS